jgi:hypothetical protein
LQHQFGNKWADFALKIPGRTDNAIKNRWNSTLNRILKRIVADCEANGVPSPSTAEEKIALIQVQINAENGGSSGGNAATAGQVEYGDDDEEGGGGGGDDETGNATGGGIEGTSSATSIPGRVGSQGGVLSSSSTSTAFSSPQMSTSALSSSAGGMTKVKKPRKSSLKKSITMNGAVPPLPLQSSLVSSSSIEDAAGLDDGEDDVAAVVSNRSSFRPTPTPESNSWQQHSTPHPPQDSFRMGHQQQHQQRLLNQTSSSSSIQQHSQRPNSSLNHSFSSAQTPLPQYQQQKGVGYAQQHPSSIGGVAVVTSLSSSQTPIAGVGGGRNDAVAVAIESSTTKRPLMRRTKITKRGEGGERGDVDEDEGVVHSSSSNGNIVSPSLNNDANWQQGHHLRGSSTSGNIVLGQEGLREDDDEEGEGDAHSRSSADSTSPLYYNGASNSSSSSASSSTLNVHSTTLDSALSPAGAATSFRLNSSANGVASRQAAGGPSVGGGGKRKESLPAKSRLSRQQQPHTIDANNNSILTSSTAIHPSSLSTHESNLQVFSNPASPEDRLRAVVDSKLPHHLHSSSNLLSTAPFSALSPPTLQEGVRGGTSTNARINKRQRELNQQQSHLAATPGRSTFPLLSPSAISHANGNIQNIAGQSNDDMDGGFHHHHHLAAPGSSNLLASPIPFDASTSGLNVAGALGVIGSISTLGNVHDHSSMNTSDGPIVASSLVVVKEDTHRNVAHGGGNGEGGGKDFVSSSSIHQYNNNNMTGKDFTLNMSPHLRQGGAHHRSMGQYSSFSSSSSSSLSSSALVGGAHGGVSTQRPEIALDDDSALAASIITSATSTDYSRPSKMMVMMTNPESSSHTSSSSSSHVLIDPAMAAQISLEKSLRRREANGGEHVEGSSPSQFLHSTSSMLQKQQSIQSVQERSGNLINNSNNVINSLLVDGMVGGGGGSGSVPFPTFKLSAHEDDEVEKEKEGQTKDRSRHQHLPLNSSGIGRLPDSPPTVSSSSVASTLLLNRARSAAATTASISALNESERQTNPVRLNVIADGLQSSSSTATATQLHNNNDHSMIPFRTPPAQRFFLSTEGETAGRAAHQPTTPISFLSPNGAADAIMAHALKVGQTCVDSSTPEMNLMNL